MVALYLTIGTVTGIAAAIWIGLFTGSVGLALLAWAIVGTLALFVAALAVYLRPDADNDLPVEQQIIPAE